MPTEVFERHSADAVRYWAGQCALGIDAAFDEKQMKDGRRLAIKILNASKFTLGMEAESTARSPSRSTSRCSRRSAGRGRGDRSASTPTSTPKRSRSSERFFWGFTDDYLELVKQRAYGVRGAEAAGSAVAALRRLWTSCCGVRPVPAVRHRGGLVLVARGLVHRSPWPAAGRPPSRGRRSRGLRDRGRCPHGAVRRRRRSRRCRCARAARRVTVRDTARAPGEARARRGRPVRGGEHREARARRVGRGVAVEVELAHREPLMRFADAARRARRAAARAHAGSVAGPDPRDRRPARSSATDVSHDPCHRHEREVHRRARGGRGRVRARDHRPVSTRPRTCCR